MAFSFRSKKESQPAKKRSLPRRIWRFVWKSVMWFFIITILWTLAYRWINPPTTYLQIRESCNCPEGKTFQKKWVDAEEISLYMKLAVVASEDNNFMKHDGFDWGAIEKARKHNEKSKKTRGASTISQQVAKNVFLWPARSWVRKGFEVYFTFLLEFFWPKERVMEVYLNVIEMGPCIFGVEAAATTYFGKHASQLTRDEAALIAGALPNPKKMNPGKPGAYLQKRRAQITRLMRLIGENYFERYSSDWPEEKRMKEEQEVEEKLESVPESERPQPEVIEEETSNAPEEIPVEVTPEEPAPADSLSQ
jgi:monofunctional glycosyltransferase